MSCIDQMQFLQKAPPNIISFSLSCTVNFTVIRLIFHSHRDVATAPMVTSLDARAARAAVHQEELLQAECKKNKSPSLTQTRRNLIK